MVTHGRALDSVRPSNTDPGERKRLPERTHNPDGSVVRGDPGALAAVHRRMSIADVRNWSIRRKLVTAGVLLAVLAGFVWLRGTINLEDLHRHAGELNGGVVLLCLLILPLVGFPVSVMHAITGARFGFALGQGFVGLSILAQLAISYWIVRAAPGFFEKRFESLRRGLPPATHASLTLFVLLLPGAPYFAQNYLLALAGVPFRYFLLFGLPIHFCRSIIGVVFGEWSGHMTPGRIACFVAYVAFVILACGLSFRRLRSQLRNRPRAEGGRRQCGSAGSVERSHARS